MLLLDKKRQVAVDVADNLVNEALATGNYELRPGVRVPVTLPDGSAGELDSDELPKALSLGVRYRTAEEDRQAAQAEIKAIRKQAADMPVTAAIAGVARGATLGLSDVAIRTLGGKDVADFARQVKEESPTASLIGEIGGGIAGLATPLTPVSAVTALGARAAGVVGRGAQSLTAVQKMGQALVGGAVEGAGIGVGQTVSEAALADPELTVQKGLANVGLSTLLGGSLSAVGRGLLEGSKAATVNLLQGASKTELATKPAEVVAGQLAQAFGGASAIVKQIDDPLWNKLWNKGSKQFRESVLDGMSNPNKVLQDVATQFDDIKRFGSELSAVASDGAKIQANILDSQVGRTPKRLLQMLDDEEAAQFGTEAILADRVLKGPKLVQAEKEAGYNVFDRIQQSGKDLVNKADDLLSKLRTGNEKERSFGRSAIYDDATVRDFAGRVEEFSKSVASATKPSEVAQAMTKFKNETAQLIKIPKGKTKDLLRVENRAYIDTVDELTPFWKEVKDTTVSKEVFGDLGAAMAMRADTISNVLQATDDLMGRFYRIVPGKTMNSREYVPDLGKINQYIVNPEAARNAVKTEAIDRIKTKVKDAVARLEPIDIKSSLDDVKRLEKELVKVQRVPANKAGAATKEEKIKFLEQKISGIKQEIDDAKRFNETIGQFKQSAMERVQGFEKAFDVAIEKRNAILMVNRLESATGRSLLGGAAGFGVSQVGSLFGVDTGPVTTGAAILGGLALANPKSMLKYLSAMENAATGFDKMATGAAARFKNLDKKLIFKEGLTGKAVPAIRQSIIREKLRVEPGERHDNDEKAYKAHVKKLGDLQRDPEALFQRISDAAGEDAQQSPRMLIETYATASRGLAFLESKLPRDPTPMGMYPDDYVPSPVEMSRYSDYAEAVFKPKVIVKQLAAGDVNPRTVEAIKAVYPRLYQDLLTQVTGALMTPKRLPYDQQVQLGILFDVPSVKALQPGYLARMMEYNGAQPQEPGQAAPNSQAMNRTQMVGMREMRVSEREQQA